MAWTSSCHAAHATASCHTAPIPCAMRVRLPVVSFAPWPPPCAHTPPSCHAACAHSPMPPPIMPCCIPPCAALASAGLPLSRGRRSFFRGAFRFATPCPPSPPWAWKISINCRVLKGMRSLAVCRYKHRAAFSNMDMGPSEMPMEPAFRVGGVIDRITVEGGQASW